MALSDQQQLELYDTVSLSLDRIEEVGRILAEACEREGTSRAADRLRFLTASLFDQVRSARAGLTNPDSPP
jgi:hypothetical protein